MSQKHEEKIFSRLTRCYDVVCHQLCVTRYTPFGSEIFGEDAEISVGIGISVVAGLGSGSHSHASERVQEKKKWDP